MPTQKNRQACVIGPPLITAFPTACFQRHIRSTAADGVDMVDMVDMVDGGCGIVCSSSFSLQYVPHVVQALACSTFRAFRAFAAMRR